jgi:glycosyltransferase involved in cell wall biosynthesis
MVDNPKISVIMSVYNGERYLKEAIESILGQTFTDFEFIIVDDASTDSSPEIMRSYSDTRIRIIKNRTNIGLTRSLNMALEQAHGELVARQDDDDISLPERFAKQIRYFMEHPETAVLGTSIYIIDENGGKQGKRILSEDPSINNFQGGWFAHGSVMFQSQIVRRLGGYNELFRYSQDFDLWLRIARHYPVRGLPQLLYMLRFHDENLQFTNRIEGVLYRLLALRMSLEELDEEIFKDIKDNGIRSFQHHLNKGEQIFFHKSMAHMHVQANDMKLARAEYRRALKLSPLEFYDYLNIILSYFGKGAWNAAHRLFFFLKSI